MAPGHAIEGGLDREQVDGKTNEEGFHGVSEVVPHPGRRRGRGTATAGTPRRSPRKSGVEVCGEKGSIPCERELSISGVRLNGGLPTSADKEDLARKLGATHFINAASTDLTEPRREGLRGNPVVRSFDPHPSVRRGAMR